MNELTNRFISMGNTVPIDAKFADAKPGLIGGDSEEKILRYRQLLTLAAEYNRLNAGYAEMTVVTTGSTIRTVTKLIGGAP